MARRLSLPPVAALALAVLAARGLGAWACGFYNDDYSWWGAVGAAPTVSGAFKALWTTRLADFASRPSGSIVYSFLFGSFGPHPLPFQLLYVGVDVLVAWLFFRLMKEEGMSEGASLATAMLAAIYPNHDSTRFWTTNSASSMALAGVLGSLLLQRRGFRLGACLMYVVSSLLYESAALLALFPFVRDSVETRDVRASFKRSWELILSLFFVVAYQRILVPAHLGLERHGMSLSLKHAFDVFAAGLECSLFNRLTHLISRSFIWAAANFGLVEWAMLAAATVLLAATSNVVTREDKPTTKILVLGMAFLFLGYLPFVFDAKYTPEIFTPNNRLNLVPSLGAACLVAWACLRWRRLAPAVAVCFLLADRVSLAQWARASARQREVLDALAPRLAAECEPGDLLLYGVEERIGSATVFESVYDFDGALRLRGICPATRGFVATGRVRFEDSRAVLSWFGEFPLEYRTLRAWDARTGTLARVRDRRAGEAL